MVLSGICTDSNEKSASIHFRHPEEIALNLPDGIELRFTFQEMLVAVFTLLLPRPALRKRHIYL